MLVESIFDPFKRKPPTFDQLLIQVEDELKEFRGFLYKAHTRSKVQEKLKYWESVVPRYQKIAAKGEAGLDELIALRDELKDINKDPF